MGDKPDMSEIKEACMTSADRAAAEGSRTTAHRRVKDRRMQEDAAAVAAGPADDASCMEGAG